MRVRCLCSNHFRMLGKASGMHLFVVWVLKCWVIFESDLAGQVSTSISNMLTFDFGECWVRLRMRTMFCCGAKVLGCPNGICQEELPHLFQTCSNLFWRSVE